MRCKHCDYSLWNVRGRTCPECGHQFNPAEHSFLPNMVEFCCVHCEQPYYGTDAHGLLVPQEFVCVKCGQPCSMAGDMFCRLAPGAAEAEVEVGELPWIRRASIGRVRAAWRTLKMCIGSPGKVGLALRNPRSPHAARWLLLLCIPMFVSALLSTVVKWLIEIVFWGGRGSGMPSASDLISLAIDMAIQTMVPTGSVWVCLIGAAVVCWLIVRMADRSVPFKRVFAVWAFASSPLVLGVIPCLGPWCMMAACLVWTPILAGIMLGRCTHSGAARIIISVAIPPITVALLAVGGLVAFVMIVTQIMGGGPLPAPAVQVQLAPAVVNGDAPPVTEDSGGTETPEGAEEEMDPTPPSERK